MTTNNLKFNTCGLADTMISYYDTMKENGMPEDELEIVMDSYMKIVELNQKYVNIEKQNYTTVKEMTENFNPDIHVCPCEDENFNPDLHVCHCGKYLQEESK